MNRTSQYLFCPYDGKPLRGSESHLRCEECGFVDYQNPAPCVCFLILQDSSVLLARRADEPSKGMWDIPGGFIDAGETAEQTVVRETQEETSLQVRVSEFLGSLPDVYGARSVPTLTFCFLVEVVAGTLRAQSDAAELRWFTFDCLPPQMAFGHQLQMLRWGKDRIRSRMHPGGTSEILGR